MRESRGLEVENSRVPEWYRDALDMKGVLFSIAFQSGFSAHDAEDMFQDVVAKFLESKADDVEKYDYPSIKYWFGLRFRGVVLDELRKKDPLGRSSRGAMKMINKEVSKVGGDLDQALGNLGVSNDDYCLVKRGGRMGRVRQTRSTRVASEYGEDVNVDNYSSVFHNLIAVDETLPEELLIVDECRGVVKDAVLQVFSLLPLRHAVVFFLREWCEKTCMEVANVLGVTESRVSQIMIEIEKKLEWIFRKVLGESFSDEALVSDLEDFRDIDDIEIGDLSKHIRALILERCKTEADKVMVGNWLRAMGNFDLITESRKVGGIENISDEILGMAGYERFCKKSRRKGTGAVWGLRRIDR